MQISTLNKYQKVTVMQICVTYEIKRLHCATFISEGTKLNVTNQSYFGYRIKYDKLPVITLRYLVMLQKEN